jgi:surface antigen
MALWLKRTTLTVLSLLLCSVAVTGTDASASPRHRAHHHHARHHHHRRGRGGGRGAGDPGNDYPARWQNAPQDSTLDSWGEENRECTSFAAWALSSRNGFNMPFNANARDWGTQAAARGYAVNSTPAIGSIAWSGPGDHVAWVAAVGTGTVFIEEYNYDYHGHYHDRWVPTGMFQYIHFKDISSGNAGSSGTPAQPIQGGGTQPIQGGGDQQIQVTGGPPIQGGGGQGGGATSGPVYTVMNTSETPPDGVWFRNSPHINDTDRVTGHGVYMNEQVQVHCYAWGDAVGPYSNSLWYNVTNVTRPTNNGAPNVGYLNAHYVNDGAVANQVDSGVPAC